MMTLDELQKELSNAVFKATGLIELHEDQIRGNAHHIRQQVCSFAETLLAERWKTADGQAPKRQRRTICQYELGGIRRNASTFRDMLQMVIANLLETHSDIAVETLCGVSPSIQHDRVKRDTGAGVRHIFVQIRTTDINGKVLPNGRVWNVGVYVDMNQTANQLETLARRCIAAFGFQPDDLILIP